MRNSTKGGPERQPPETRPHLKADFNFLTGNVTQPEKGSTMATTPMPDDGVKQQLQRDSTPASPVFWGRKREAVAASGCLRLRAARSRSRR